MFKKTLPLLVLCLAFAVSSFAAIDAPTQALITAGISSADATYYSIGGALLVVMAGIWGFKRVKSLMGS